MLTMLLAVTLVLGCASSSSNSEGHWYRSMQDLSNTLSDLLPRVIPTSGPLTNEDKRIVSNDINRLSQIAHKIDASANIPLSDMTLRIVSREFKSETKELEKLINQESWSEVRPRAYQLTKYCISCHTLNTGGSSSYTMKFNSPKDKFSNFEKAQYYTAIRQFEQAIIYFEYALTDTKWASQDPEDWNKSIMMLLSIVTHVKKDPDLTLDLISRFFDTKAYPPQLRPAARLWREQVLNWQSQRTPADLNAVEEWIGAAAKIKQPKHGNAFLLLRASSRLHELLSTSAVKKADEQRALYLAGVVGLELGEFNFLYFPNQYLETCIRLQSGNSLSKKCFKKLSEEWAVRYSPIDEDRKKTLAELKSLAGG